MRRSWLILALSLGAVPASAQQAEARHACAHAESQRVENECLGRVVDSLQMRLDTLLGALHRTVAAANWERLNGSQQRWQQYQRAECNWQSGIYEGGTIMPAIEARCEAGMLSERIGALKIYLCPGAPLTGGPCDASKRYDQLPEPESSSPGIDERLFFGRNIPAGGAVSDSAWSVFLAEVVTPRLPDGFTVYRTEGQWRDPRGTIVHEPGMILEVTHPMGTPPDSVFDAIARMYCARFGQDAVFRTSEPVTMKMILGAH